MIFWSPVSQNQLGSVQHQDMFQVLPAHQGQTLMNTFCTQKENQNCSSMATTCTQQAMKIHKAKVNPKSRIFLYTVFDREW
jgi:hypothetical protein